MQHLQTLTCWLLSWRERIGLRFRKPRGQVKRARGGYWTQAEEVATNHLLHEAHCSANNLYQMTYLAVIATDVRVCQRLCNERTEGVYPVHGPTVVGIVEMFTQARSQKRTLRGSGHDQEFGYLQRRLASCARIVTKNRIFSDRDDLRNSGL